MGSKNFIKKLIKLDTVEKVKDFAAKIYHIEPDADLSSVNREYKVDAKSILGIFSLDTTQPLELTIHDDEENAGKYAELIEKFAYKE